MVKNVDKKDQKHGINLKMVNIKFFAEIGRKFLR